MNTKKRKKKRKKTKHISRKQMIILGGIAFSIAIFMFASFYIVFGTYNGLGLSKSVEKNTCNNSLYYRENGFIKYDDEEYTSMVGVDVSTFQGDIDWSKVKASGVEFAMIRLGYRGAQDGQLHLDDSFEKNLKEAKNVGLKVGVYFFSQAITVDESIDEAKFVIRHIRLKGITLPVAYDMEPLGTEEEERIAKLTRDDKTKITDAFCSIVNRNGYDAMVYGNYSWLKRKLDLSFLTNYEIWFAQYNNSCDSPFKYQMWQYTNEGIISGINGYVDLNLLLVKK